MKRGCSFVGTNNSGTSHRGGGLNSRCLSRRMRKTTREHPATNSQFKRVSTSPRVRSQADSYRNLSFLQSTTAIQYQREERPKATTFKKTYMLVMMTKWCRTDRMTYDNDNDINFRKLCKPGNGGNALLGVPPALIVGSFLRCLLRPSANATASSGRRPVSTHSSNNKCFS
ncbi:hypothetical protein DICVIV_07252 [Dictyocaulus viviparus]|uniref:Uncharacterized protein n=1 Tax=Dictyocaulus viviparus TaxID=29172 RepID=A0A0D8XPZ1_DICVI|nr:hypothetical protein DICVIV_07252 [Dictyocaulus viviparus]